MGNPRHWSEQDLDTLRTLADAAVAEVELRIASRELAERESRFRGALENIRAIAVTLDLEGNITFVNDHLVELTGWSRDELLGRNWFDTLVPAEEREDRRSLFVTISHGTIATHNEGFLLTKSGECRIIAWDNILLRHSNGDAHGVAGIGRDMTAERQTQRLKDELIGLVSHELRGPLTAIRGGLKLMSPHVAELDEKSQRLFHMAVRNGDRLLRLVNDLLDLERLDAGSIPMARQPVTLAQLIADARDTTQATADAARVKIDTQVADDEIEADPDRIVQVLTNLILNGIKFSPAGESICVVGRVADGVAHFEVRDHGRGIPEEQLEHVFERFAQVESDDAKKKGGAGLGLSISRAIVAQHGGRIWVESKPGHGATFHFTVPREAR